MNKMLDGIRKEYEKRALIYEFLERKGLETCMLAKKHYICTIKP
jgi:hypothetical protein